MSLSQIKYVKLSGIMLTISTICIYFLVIMSMCACGKKYLLYSLAFSLSWPSYQMYLTLGRSPISVPSSTTAGSSVLPLARRRCRCCRCCRCPSSRSKEDSPCLDQRQGERGRRDFKLESLGHLDLGELSFRNLAAT